MHERMTSTHWIGHIVVLFRRPTLTQNFQVVTGKEVGMYLTNREMKSLSDWSNISAMRDLALKKHMKSLLKVHRKCNLFFSFSQAIKMVLVSFYILLCYLFWQLIHFVHTVTYNIWYHDINNEKISCDM